MSTDADVVAGGAPLVSAEHAARVTAFARACRAAARATALYPAEHPAVATTLSHVVSAAGDAATGGELRLGVSPDTLTVDGRKLAKTDAAVAELAAMLHAHQLGQLSILPLSTPEAWRRFLALLTLAPDQARRRGGLSRLWASEGQTGIATRQIDYSLLLLDRIHGEPATWDAVVAECLEGDAQLCDDWVVNLVLEILNRPEDVGHLLTAVKDRTAGTAGGSAVVVVSMLHALAEFVSRTQPEQLEPLLIAMAEATSRLSTAELAAVTTQGRTSRRRGQQAFVDGLARRMTDASLAEHVVEAMSRGEGSSPVVAQFLGGCAPDVDRRSSIVALARHMLDQAGSGSVPADFQAHAERLIGSHDDRPFVADAYAAELHRAAARAVDLDRDATDPPDRIAAWTHSVSDERIRNLDAHLLVDMMQRKREVTQWREVAGLAISRVSIMVVVGDFAAAAFLLEAISLQHEDHPDLDVRAAAGQAAADVLNADLMHHIASHLDTAETAVVNNAKRFCQAVGPSALPFLAEVLSREERTRPRQHLMAILTSFGAAGRQSVERLMQSSNAAVRRTAVMLLREFGGPDALPTLEAMLQDEEPHVQREATRAIAQLAIEPAYEALVRALMTGRQESRAAMTSVLWSLPPEETAPLLAFIVTRAPIGATMSSVQERALQRLASAPSDSVVRALAAALGRGSVWAPLRTQVFRRQAAQALARAATPHAIEHLQAASIGGSWGVRRAARAGLAALPSPSGPTKERHA